MMFFRWEVGAGFNSMMVIIYFSLKGFEKRINHNQSIETVHAC